MSKKLKFLAMMLTCILLSINQMLGQASVGTTMWAEDFSGYSADDVPDGSTSNSHTGTTVYNSGSVTYSCGGSGSTPKIMDAGSPGTGNNMILYQNNGYFEISGIPTGGATELTLSYAVSGSGTLNISCTSANASISGTTITISSGSTFDLKFKNTKSNKNLRLDDLSVVVKTAGSGSTKTLSSLAITTAPTKTKYVVGETFSKTGAVVTATYSDETTADVSSSATWTPTTGLVAGSNTMTASYTEGGVNKTATTTVTAYAVTLQARDEDGNTIAVGGPGAPSRTGASITPAADAGNYVFKEWQITNASLGSSASTKSNTITNPTGAVTVTAVYYKPITITYKANSQNFTTQTYAYGGTLAFPASNPDGATYSCDGKTFVGWVGEANKDYSHASIAPTYATAGGSVTAAATYYAVFATSAGELLNSYAAITSGLETANYVIAYSYNGGTQIVLKNAADNSSPSDKLKGYNLSLTASKYSNPGASYIWELQAQPDGSYYIYNADAKKYVNATIAALTLSTTPTKFTISYDGTNSRWTIQIKDNSTYYVHGYVNSSAYDFRVSTSGSGSKYRIYLYKQESNITYSAYATTCSTEPRLNVTPTSLDFGNVANGTYKEMTFSLSGTNLAENASIAVSGTNSSYFTVSPSSVNKGSGTISATDITVRYTPGAVGDGHTATVTVTSGETEPKTVTLTGNGKASYTVTCSPASNGSVLADKTSNVMSGETVTLTISPSSGYQLSSISAVDGSSNPVSLSGTGNTRTFTMPASNVTVTSAFVVRTDYVLVESALDDYSGEYLIVYHSTFDNFYALSGRQGNQNTDTYGTITDVTTYYDADAKAIASNATTDAMKMIIEPGQTANTYTIYFENDNSYLGMTPGNTATGNKLRFVTSANLASNSYEWTISLPTGKTYHYISMLNNAVSPTRYYLNYNTDNSKFGLYTNQSDPELYKKAENCTKLAAPTGLAEADVTHRRQLR